MKAGSDDKDRFISRLDDAAIVDTINGKANHGKSRIWLATRPLSRPLLQSLNHAQ